VGQMCIITKVLLGYRIPDVKVAASRYESC